MVGDWRKVRFLDIYAIPSRNGLTKPQRIRGGGTKFINMREIFGYGRMDNIPCERVPLTLRELETSKLKEGDLLFARQSLVLSGAGKCSIFLRDDEDVVFESHLIRVRVNESFVDPEYIYYFFNSPLGRAEIWGITEQGAGQAGIRGSDLGAVEVPIPSLPEQRKIVSVLRSIDKKFELNTQLNQTLESMAQALFKSWFVDFDPVIDNAIAAGNPIPEPFQARAERRRQRLHEAVTEGQTPLQPLPDELRRLFPDAFQETEELGWVPEGWVADTIDNNIELIGGGTPKTTVEEYWGGSIPWFSVVDAPNTSDVFVISTEKKITEIGLKNSSTRILEPGTTIISARGTVGKCAVVGVPMAMNQSCYGIKGKSGFADYFTYYLILLNVGNLQQRGHGSVFNTITRDTFRAIFAVSCGELLSRKFDETVSAYFDRIKSNLVENTQLTSIRDLLLPKLLSGQLRIPDAEAQLAEAGV